MMHLHQCSVWKLRKLVPQNHLATSVDHQQFISNLFDYIYDISYTLDQFRAC